MPRSSPWKLTRATGDGPACEKANVSVYTSQLASLLFNRQNNQFMNSRLFNTYCDTHCGMIDDSYDNDKCLNM